MRLKNKQLVLFPKFRASLGIAQTITTFAVDGNQKVNIDTEQFDTNANFDIVNKRFLPTIKGKYNCGGSIQFNTTIGSYQLFIMLFKNGSLFSRANISVAQLLSTQIFQVVDLIDMNGTTDYLELFVSQTSGVNMTIGAGSASSYFWGALQPGE